jgi:two-component system sensor histidine kinase GlrK
MKVSSKIIVGFLVLMLLSVIVLVLELSAIHQMQAVNRDLSGINVIAATSVLRLQKLAELLGDDSKKYLGTLYPEYDGQLSEFRDDFLEELDRLKKTLSTDRERIETEKLSVAMDDFWTVFNRFKAENKSWAPDDLPPDITIAVNHLQAQGEVMLDAVQLGIKERVATAAAVGAKAERVAWIAGSLSLLLAIVVSALIASSINEPLQRLTQGTRAIAKGEFWHRLPDRGKDEFSELARDLNVMTERLAELDEMKKGFVSHVSHDLKAPLASIRQIMHLLLQEIPGSLNEQQKSLIHLSYNSAERLAAMVGNLLDISRMEAGTMEYRMSANDIVLLISSVAEEFEIQAREKDIQFRLDFAQESIVVECDRDRIMQVIGNLFENALKFSPAGREIATHVGPGKGNEVLITVSDSGPGVPDGHKEQIFQKFHQVKQGKKMSGQGVGLGLAICRTIVEAHHGQIWVEDNPKGGSVFSFVLKAATREEALTCGQSA